MVVERIGVFGESLTFADAAHKTLYGCDGGVDAAGERKPPWCGNPAGLLFHGKLLDPRLDVLCRDREGRPLAYAWVEPVAGVRLDRCRPGRLHGDLRGAGGLTRADCLRSRHPTRSGARQLRSDAVRQPRKGAGQGKTRGRGCGLIRGVDSVHSVGADLADGDHEDPHPLPLLGRLLGDQVRACTRAAGRARAGCRRVGPAALAARTRPSARVRSARPSFTRVRANASRYGAAVSSTPYRRSRPAETVGGFLAAASIFLSLAGVAYRPLRLVPFAILLALIAVGIGGRNERLATYAVSIGAVCFAVGMAVAVITSHPLW